MRSQTKPPIDPPSISALVSHKPTHPQHRVCRSRAIEGTLRHRHCVLTNRRIGAVRQPVLSLKSDWPISHRQMAQHFLRYCGWEDDTWELHLEGLPRNQLRVIRVNPRCLTKRGRRQKQENRYARIYLNVQSPSNPHQHKPKTRSWADGGQSVSYDSVRPSKYRDKATIMQFKVIHRNDARTTRVCCHGNRMGPSLAARRESRSTTHIRSNARDHLFP